MPLTTGARVGSYEVTGALGAGGMGEVYRAHDTQLRRDVAIKILPASLADDADRVARFAREAQVLAALNHPRIAAVYGLERSGSVTAIVMELVEGETLAERLARGRIPLHDALDIAVQILDALDAAHERGIVHRDLKPANIKLTPDGAVKVLDFGLAKADVAVAGIVDSPSINSPTVAAGLTVAGLILGTAAYMSPEQARGRAVDKRADIWAFGCVLFEMLAGRPVFDGSDTSEIIAGVIKSEVPWNALPADTPPRIRRVLQRCLEKDPRRRIRDAADVRFELDEALASPAAAPASSSATPVRPRSRLPWIIAGILAVAVVALATTSLRAPAPSAEPIWFSIDAPQKPFNAQVFPIVAPDGRTVVFAAPDAGGSNQLWLRRFDSPVARMLPGTAAAIAPMWSPDGRSIAFFSGGKLKRLDLDATAAQTLADAGNPRGGTWGPDNVILFAPLPYGGIFKVSASGGSGGAVTAVTTLNREQQEIEHSSPHVLPDGRHFLFSLRSNVDGRSGIYVRAIDAPATENSTFVAPIHSRVEYAAGYLFFGREQTLLAQPFDSRRLVTTGEPVRVADGLGVTYGNLWQYAFTASPAGTLAYWNGPSYSLTQLRELDRTGKVIRNLGSPAEDYTLALSPDGATLALERHDPVANAYDIWTMQTATGALSRLTTPTRPWRWNGTPIWSPDSGRVLYTEFTDRFIIRDARGNRPPEFQSHHLGNGNWPADWSHDGKYVAVVSGENAGYDIAIVPTDGTAPPISYTATAFTEGSPAISPNSRWLAYSSNDSGRDEVYLDAFPRPDRKVRVSTAGGRQIRWRGDGRELFYLAPDGNMMSVDVREDASGVQTSPPRVLFDAGSALYGRGSASRTQFVVFPKGDRFIVNALVDDQRPGSINVLVNLRAVLDRNK